MTPPPPVSVVVPARDAAGTLPRCLAALARALADPRLAGSPGEVLVVDDGSTDGTRAVAEAGGARVLPLPAGRTGAAAARNHGAAAARGVLLAFVDADVIVAPEALGRLVERVAGDPAVAAAVGVYEPCDAALGVWSRVKDLTVRMNHARGGEEIRWFWTALGVVRAAAFRAVGGFDARRFGRGATVEDMDLGFRLSARGHRIVQVAHATGRHLHRFGPGGLVRNDFAKSRDWARLLLRDGPAAARSHGATGRGEAAALAASLVALTGLGVAPLLPAPGLLLAAAGAGAVAWHLRADLRRAWRERGPLEPAEYLGVRLGLYPVAAAGALWGALGA